MSSEMQMPSSRYVLPSFVEHSAFGAKESNPYNKLFEERIIFLGTQVDDASANDIMAQLLVLEGQDPDRDITMYINSPGGSFTSLMAIYDTMQYVRPDVQTVCLGQAASAAAVLLAAAFELRDMPETPYPVIINEAIEVTKTFGGIDGHKFVNGILDKLAAGQRPHDPKHH